MALVSESFYSVSAPSVWNSLSYKPNCGSAELVSTFSRV